MTLLTDGCVLNFLQVGEVVLKLCCFGPGLYWSVHVSSHYNSLEKLSPSVEYRFYNCWLKSVAWTLLTCALIGHDPFGYHLKLMYYLFYLLLYGIHALFAQKVHNKTPHHSQPGGNYLASVIKTTRTPWLALKELQLIGSKTNLDFLTTSCIFKTS